LGVIELAAMGFITVLAALISVNVGVLCFAAWSNDSACREATRAAAQRPTANDAKVAAAVVAQQFTSSPGSVVTSPKVLLDGNKFEYQIFPDADGKPQMDQGPFVRVTTQSIARLPVAIIFNGAKLTDTIAFTQSYTFPILTPDTADADDGLDDALVTDDEDAAEEEAKKADVEGADETIPVYVPTPEPAPAPAPAP